MGAEKTAIYADEEPRQSCHSWVSILPQDPDTLTEENVSAKAKGANLIAAL